jgi:hypothetical protein
MHTLQSRDVTDMVKNIRLSPKNEDEAIAFSDQDRKYLKPTLRYALRNDQGMPLSAGTLEGADTLPFSVQTLENHNMTPFSATAGRRKRSIIDRDASMERVYYHQSNLVSENASIISILNRDKRKAKSKKRGSVDNKFSTLSHTPRHTTIL